MTIRYLATVLAAAALAGTAAGGQLRSVLFQPDALGSVIEQAAEYGGPALVDVVAQSLEEAAAPVLQWMG